VLRHLPALNATLNALSACLLALGYLAMTRPAQRRMARSSALADS